mmetsp:Transcript_49877/g.89552  ORF Transcript_49877/g.89552 Transcript_49877/m.89552 type:complete len:82 (+) Transcript_49877:1042-1287(+)
MLVPVIRQQAQLLGTLLWSFLAYMVWFGRIAWPQEGLTMYRRPPCIAADLLALVANSDGAFNFYASSGGSIPNAAVCSTGV